MTKMRARDTKEQHRTATPLELLFDLTFVVAVAQIALQLAHATEDGHGFEAIGPFLMVFFAIWWAWNQFTWLASAYDNDGAYYRIFTMVQMAGVLVIAAGVPFVFTDENWVYITVGYLIMRSGLLAILVRVLIEDPESRPTTKRYVIGIAAVQVGWLLRLLFPEDIGVLLFFVLVAAELLVSPWADRAGPLAWHPHHIAERYGLFVIILLGETVFASTAAVQRALEEGGATVALGVTAASGLVLLFTLWWLYFAQPAAEGLVNRRERSYVWGYGHYFLFASLAAIGAGLEVTVAALGEHIEASALVVGYSVAIPLSLFIILVWALHAPLVERTTIRPLSIVIAAALVLAAPLAAPVLTTVGVLVAMTAVTALLLAWVLVSKARTGARSLDL